MAKISVFVSFDFDNDENLKHSLIGQAKIDESPFEVTDYSVKEELSGDWVEKVRKRIQSVDRVIVMCGKHTHQATGVATELRLAKKLDVPYFLLKGHPKETCKKPTSASDDDTIYDWTWPNLEKLLNGNR